MINKSLEKVILIMDYYCKCILIIIFLVYYVFNRLGMLYRCLRKKYGW